MKITVLGSGTFIPELKRKCSSYLIETEKEKIIFDLGRGAIDRLLELKINFYDLDKIFISHMHTDHSTELFSFIQLILDTPKKKKLKEKYTIYGPKGIKKDIIKILGAFHIDKHKHLDRIEVKEISNKNIININKIKIKAFEVIHIKGINCLAYRIEYKNKVVCYSGDSNDCIGLRNACKNSDLAIIDGTGPKEWGLKAHLNGEELGKLAKETNIKKLIATHVADTYTNRVEKDIKKNYNGKIIMAKDLMKINI